MVHKTPENHPRTGRTPTSGLPSSSLAIGNDCGIMRFLDEGRRAWLPHSIVDRLHSDGCPKASSWHASLFKEAFRSGRRLFRIVNKRRCAFAGGKKLNRKNKVSVVFENLAVPVVEIL